MIVAGSIIAAAICYVVVTSRLVSADAIVPIMVSLYHWTPFFWGAARMGMLIPLLALPVSHPMWNLFLELLATTSLLFAAPLFVGRFVYGRATGVVCGLATSVLLVCLYPKSLILATYAFTGQPYGTGLALCFGGLCLIDENRSTRVSPMLGGAVLIFLAMWACPSIAFSALTVIVVTRVVPAVWRAQATSRLRRRVSRAPVAVQVDEPRELASGIRLFPQPARGMDVRDGVLSRAGLMCLLVMAGVGCSAILSRLISTREGTALVSILHPREWVSQRTLLRLFQDFDLWFVGSARFGPGSFGMLALVAALALYAAKPGIRREMIRSSAALAAGIAGEIGVMSWLAWTAHSINPGHYLFVSLLLLLMLPTGVLVLLIEPKLPRNYLPKTILGLALISAVMVNNGVPSPSRFVQGLNHRWGAYVDEVAARKATYVAGDYWKVWPIVFLAYARSFDQHPSSRIWGLTAGAEATSALWDDFDTTSHVVAVPVGDDLTEVALRLDLTLEPGERWSKMTSYRSLPRQKAAYSPDRPAWLHDAPTPGLECYVDVVENRSEQVDGGRRNGLHMAGWAVEPRSESRVDSVAVELMSADGKNYFADAHTMVRPDVDAKFKSAAMVRSGFSVTAWSDSVIPGTYTVRILQSRSGRSRYCDPGRTVQIE